MKSLRWFALEAAISIGSLGIGWVLPDGLSVLAELLGQDTPEVTPTERLLAAMVVFIFATSMHLLLRVREEIHEVREDVPRAVAGLLDATILRLFLDSVAQRPESAVTVERVVGGALNLLTKGDQELLEARAVLLDRALSDAMSDVGKLVADGLDVNIEHNNEITRRLAAGGRSYRQIQRKAYEVPGEWTHAWRSVVDDLRQIGIACEYVVLAERDALEQDRAKLATMNDYLTARDWPFYVCDLQDALDALGGRIPTGRNVEVFDTRLVKTQEVPKSSYAGGITLRITVHELDARPDLKRLNDAVTKYMKSYRAYFDR